jgi:argininosuccinate lyase
MTLWNKGYTPDEKMMKFTAGKDPLLDLNLVKYDCIASIAHAKMLHKTGLLNEEELSQLVGGLNEIIVLSEQGKFEIKSEEEDCHTAIEDYLTKKYGDSGKKLHTCRSRNDQVLTAIRLYEKDELSEVKSLIGQLKSSFKGIILKYGSVRIPGYTHMQKAMPTDIKTWMGCFAFSMDDNLNLLEAVSATIDQSPLGSAAGFGVPVFEIDKEMTAKEMGFSKVMENPMYCQLSRGKFEAMIVQALCQIMLDLNKLATDLMLFSTAEFGYITLPKELCTGSSIMPQKKNPDVIELVRASYHIVLGEEMKIQGLIGNLPSGFNRDFQLTKEPLFNAIDTTKSCLDIMGLVVAGLDVNEAQCKKALTKEIYATEEAYKLAKRGMPFRDAYKLVGERLSKGM